MIKTQMAINDEKRVTQTARASWSGSNLTHYVRPGSFRKGQTFVHADSLCGIDVTANWRGLGRLPIQREHTYTAGGTAHTVHSICRKCEQAARRLAAELRAQDDRICSVCCEYFQGRAGSSYCSNKCRQAAYRDRKRGASC